MSSIEFFIIFIASLQLLISFNKNLINAILQLNKRIIKLKNGEIRIKLQSHQRRRLWF